MALRRAGMSEIVTRGFKIEFKDVDGNVLGTDFFEAEGYPDDVYREAEIYAEYMINEDAFSATYYTMKEV